VGIAAEELPHLCEPFYRAEEARRLGRPGIGLGLTVVQRIVVVLGGELRIDSVPGQGSRFSVFLPAADDPAFAAQSVVPLPEGTLSA
jgi:signal transduction histidine kinase